MQTDNAVVTAITEHPRLGGRCVVSLDGERVGALSIEQVIALKLAMGTVVDAARLADLLACVRETACYDKALATLARRARSSADLGRWLRQREYAAAEVDRVIQRLIALGLLDDLAFARGFARARLGAARGFGPRRVSAELARRGVARPIVDQVLAEFLEEGGADDSAVLDEIVARRARGMRGLASDVRERRLFGFLARRGFDSGAIWNALRRLRAVPD